MTTTCTITKAGRCDTYGRPLLVGDSYTSSDDEIKSLYMSGFCTVPDLAIFDANDDLWRAGHKISFPGFKPTLLASLVAAATATRVGLEVTINATAHGIPASTYDGFRFFVPPTASLPSGAFAQSVTRIDANVLRCTLPFGTPGSDFAGEVFSSLPFITAVNVDSLIIPAGVLQDGSDVEFVVSCGGDTSANQKLWALKFGDTTVSYTTATTVPAGRRYGGFSVISRNRQIGQLIGSSLAAPQLLTKDISVDQSVTTNIQVVAGSAGHVALFDAFLRISR